MTRVLIVRMSALGDIIHALPVLSALQQAHPALEIDWLADRTYAGILTHVGGLQRCIIGRPGLAAAVRVLRSRRYDVALDLQGLLKSAVMARLSGAARVIGFETRALRERAAAWCYDQQAVVPAGAHIIKKNLSTLVPLGITRPSAVSFPWQIPASAVAEAVRSATKQAGLRGYVLINPGAAWPNKRWPPARFGAVARSVRDEHALQPFVLWGSGEATLADEVVAASDGAAARAPATSLGDLLALSSGASLFVSGDTGPLHLAASIGTPIVGLYGPTWPERNGPWSADDVVVSRAVRCECHHKRMCQRAVTGSEQAAVMCLNEISIAEVRDAVAQRLHSAAVSQR